MLSNWTTLAEPHASLGRVRATYDWDWAGAEKEYKRSIELNPRYALAHQWYSGYLMVMGRYNEMNAEQQRARELDPVSLTTNFAEGLNLFFRRDFDAAIEQFLKTLDLDPNFPSVRIFLPAVYEQKGNFDQAIAEFEKGLLVKRGNSTFLCMAGLAHVYAVSGKKAQAEELMNVLKQRSQTEYIPGESIAMVYAGLGDKDQAFTWLEEGYNQHSFSMQFLKLDPRWDSLRSDPRFAELTRRIGLP